MATLVRWEPYRELATLHTEMSKLMNGLLDGNGGPSTQRWVPAVDVWETENELVYAFDLPGVGDDDVSVEVQDDTLTVSAERKRVEETSGERFHRFERHHGSFVRALALPQGVVPDSVEAKLDHGVLEIRVPKPEAPKPRRIQVLGSDGAQTTIEGSATAS